MIMKIVATILNQANKWILILIKETLVFLIVYELFYFDCKEDNGSEMKTNATVNLVYALTDVEIVAED